MEIFKKGCSTGNHTYKARYNYIPPTNLGNYEGNAYGFEAIVKSLTQQIYIHDICVKCGNLIKVEGK